MERNKTNIVKKKGKESVRLSHAKTELVHDMFRFAAFTVSSDVCTGSSSLGKSKNCMHYMQKSTLRAESPSIFLDKPEETLLAG